jgi:hypothetical protein
MTKYYFFQPNSCGNSPCVTSSLTRRWVPPYLKVKVTLRLTVSQSVSPGVEPHLGLMTRYLLLFEVTVLFFWGAQSDERTGLSFVFAAGPRQRSVSRVRVLWHS